MLLLYRLCLRAYPAAFRQRHATEMLHIFETEWRTAREAGLRATFAMIAHVASDLARTVPHERLAAATHTGWLAFSTATFCGVTATCIQFAGDDLRATLVVFFTGTVFFSYFAEVRTWRWPVTAAAWLPSAYAFAWALGSEVETRLGVTWSFLALVGGALAISLAGTGTGVWLRRRFPLRFGCDRRTQPVAHKNL